MLPQHPTSDGAALPANGVPPTSRHKGHTHGVTILQVRIVRLHETAAGHTIHSRCHVIQPMFDVMISLVICLVDVDQPCT
jgi:hypothetical protein